MKHLKVHSILMFFLFLAIESFAEKTIRIACVGNSITYGADISNREKNCYPAQLQEYLGKGFEVRNFGVNGCTILGKGDYPYVQTDSYKASLSFQPDIVLIKLGTNDSKPQNWKYKEEIESDYQTLIDSYRRLNSKPRVILMTPLRCFLPAGSQISAQIIEQDIRPIVEKMAYENGLEIINLFNLFGDEWQQHFMPDRLHPSSIGAGVIAQKIYEYLTPYSTQTGKELKKTLDLNKVKEFNFHGYRGYEFMDGELMYRIVPPVNEALGKPWIIHARLESHMPQADIALLENGFHLVYCDVPDLYGSDKAVSWWNNFYKRMKKVGFNKKVVLEGMSQGGLTIYNGASLNTEKEVCIYADAPVMDLDSLNNPESIVRYILNATGHARNMCTIPVPGNEYRSGAGWVGGVDWHNVAADIIKTLQGKKIKLLLLGNSIMQGWGGTREAVSYKPGKQAMDEALGIGQWESAGISGDRTQNLLWRIHYGNYNVCHPQNTVITIGINNLLSGYDSPENVADGIIAVAKEARKQLPDTRIILMGLLPSGKDKNSDIRIKCDKIHRMLSGMKIEGVEYINPTQWFTEVDGSIRPGLYSDDYIHLTAKGYAVWADEITKLIK